MSGDGDRASRSVDEIFNDALDIAPGERTAFLIKACGGDSDLQREVEELLAIADENPALLATPHPHTLPDKIGKYDIVSELGRGAMGVVYRATDPQLGREVALKVLSNQFAATPDAQERFKREGRLLASLNDPRIATLHSLEPSEGSYFITMELVDGEPLNAHLTGEPLPARRAVEIAIDIAKALERAHDKGIVHRDLKPANIMLTEEGNVKILDFGIAKAVQSPAESVSGDVAPVATALAGTPQYMSPEQFLGVGVDHRADIWALGCILYEMLTGKRPFELSETSLESPFVSDQLDLSSLPRGLPRSIVNALKGSVELDANQRIASASHFRTLLTAGLHPSRRRWLVAATIVIALAMAGRWWWTRTGPATAATKIDSVTVQATDADGHELWRRRFDGQMLVGNRLHGQWTNDFTVATFSDGDPKAIILVDGYNTPAAMLFVNANDGKTIWRREPTWTLPVNANGKSEWTWTTLVQWPGIEEPIIATCIRDHPWYSVAIEFVTSDGEVLGTYYHPGVVFRARMDVANPAPGTMLLFGGSSSARFVRDLVPFETSNHLGVVAILSLPLVDGQAFPYAENLPEKRDWPGMPPADERGYVLFPMLHARFGSSVLQMSTKAPDNPEGAAYMAWLADGRTYDLDENLRPLSCFVQLNSVADSLMNVGAATLLPSLYIHEGVQEYVDVPVEH